MLIRFFSISLLLACAVLAWGDHKGRTPAPPQSGLRHRGKLDAIAKRQVKADDLRMAKRQNCAMPAPSGVCTCPGTTLCGGTCSDLTSSSQNCGACGNACSSLMYCDTSVCTCITECDDECVDVTSDPANCGSCGTVCEPTGYCSQSTCLTCPVSAPTSCTNVCTDLDTDVANCGSCGTHCSDGETCQSGVCACPPGSPTCGSPSVYHLADAFVGPDFFSGFVWEAIPDPTDGTVNYVDQPTALALNLSFASADTFIMRADDTTVLPVNSAVGRNSVRIKTVNTYTTGVYILDLRHMPEGCGTWPAWWTTYEVGWPATGEIDIIEYVNSQPPNLETLHTNYDPPGPACIQGNNDPNQLGNQISTNCEGGDGCTTQSYSEYSAGPLFNSIGGGWYAMERTDTNINIWFWPRTSTTVPTAISTPGGPSVDTSTFGTPDSAFASNPTTCPFNELFAAHNVVFDLTFCGQFAGNNYPGTCPNGPGWAGCNDYVWQNPTAFSDAYWDVAGMWIYE